MNVVLLLESLGKLPGEKCRSKLFERELEVCGKKVLIKEDFAGDVGEIVWEMCWLMLQYVQNTEAFPPGAWKNKRVLELGAGTGLLGIALAMLGAEVVVTDIPPVLDLLAINVADAKQRYPGLSIAVEELDWFKPVPTHLYGPWEYLCPVCGYVSFTSLTFCLTALRYIIMAEVVYAPALFAPLLATVEALNAPSTRILLGYETRHTSDAEFFRLMDSKFVRTAVPAVHYHRDDGVAARSDISVFVLTALTASAAIDRVLMWYALQPRTASESASGAIARHEQKSNNATQDRLALWHSLQTRPELSLSLHTSVTK